MSGRSHLSAVPADNDAARAPQYPSSLPLQVDWQRVLRDLTASGVLRIELANSAVRWISQGEPWTASVEGHAGWIRGPGLMLAGLVDHWAMAMITRESIEESFEALEIHDHQSRRLVRLSLIEDSASSGFHVLKVRQWAKRGAPVALPFKTGRDGCLIRLQLNAGLHNCGPLPECWYGKQQQVQPGRPVDATLLVPFLETFADQLCPLSVMAGSRGLVQQHECAFFDCRVENARLKLRSSTAQLDLQLNRLASARVVDCRCREQAMRLYDDQGQCVAVLATPASAQAEERRLWQTMLRAMYD